MTTTDNNSNPYYQFYSPSIAAALIVAIIFFVGALVQIWRIIVTRQWFGIVILIASAFEIVGLLARAYSNKHLDEKGPYEIQILLILLAPILFAAAVYMILGRLIRRSGRPELCLIRIGWVTPIFVTGDIFCFFVQAIGAAILISAKSQSKLDLAKGIVLAGLALQVFFFAIFALVAIVFHLRMNRRGVDKIINPTVNLTIRLWNLYFCSLLITVRNIYRLSEYATGTDAYLSRHEWPTYALDVVLMLIILVISNFWYFPKHKGMGYEQPAIDMSYPNGARPWGPESQQALAYGQPQPYDYPPPPANTQNYYNSRF